MRTAAARFDHLVRWLESASVAVSIVAAVLLLLIVSAEVIARASATSAPAVSELGGYFMAALAFLPLGEVTRRREHINVASFIKLAPLPLSRFIERRLVPAISLVYTLTLAWLGVELVATSYSAGVRSAGELSVPEFIPQSVMAVGLCVCILSMVCQLLRGSDVLQDRSA